jgi:arsenate reductase-like glutaredoxin family protein
MTKLNKYMMVHNNPGVDCEEVQDNWRKLAQVETATWIRTYFNEKNGIRYCLWMASSEEDLKNIFTEIGISWESIIQVEETVPDLWGKKWDEHLQEEAMADTLGN